MAPKGPYRKNSYYYSDDGTQIIAKDSMGHIFILDAEDLPVLESRCFYRNKLTGYFCGRKDNKIRMIHRLVLGLGKGGHGVGGVDHINGKKWDNRNANLRVATNSENQANTGASSKSSTGVKGVFRNNPTKKWKNPKHPYKSSIRVDGKSIHLGYFDTIAEAKSAYDNAAQTYFGEFAKAI